MPLTISNLPSDVQQLTFTIAEDNPPTLMGVRAFAASSSVTFAAAPNDGSGEPWGSCTRSADGTTVTCTGIADGAADFPVSLASLASTTVAITATATGTTGPGNEVATSAATVAVSIEPPTADLALQLDSDSVTPDGSGSYEISGKVTGIPSDYAYAAPTVSVASRATDLTPVSTTMVCSSGESTKDCSFTLVVAADGITGSTPATVSVNSLPGYVDGTDGLANNSWPITLQEPDPPLTSLDLLVTDMKPVTGTNWAVTVSVTGAKPGERLAFHVTSSGKTPGDGGPDNNAVTFEPSALAGCDPITKSSYDTACSAVDGALTETFIMRIPAGQTGMLMVSDEAEHTATQELTAPPESGSSH